MESEDSMSIESEFIPLWDKEARRLVFNCIHTLQQNLEGFVAYHENDMSEQDILAVCAQAEKTKTLLSLIWQSMPR